MAGDTKLLQAAILVFVPGVIKCLERPWAIKMARINSMVKTSGALISIVSQYVDTMEKDVNSLEEYVRAAAKCMQVHEFLRGFTPIPVENLFVELLFPYCARLEELRYYWMDRISAHYQLQRALSDMFDRLYTWYKARNRRILRIDSWWKRCLVFCLNLRGFAVYLPFAAIALYHKSPREAYNATDVKITYILLCCTTAVEFSAVTVKQFILSEIGTAWPDHVSQYSLVGYLARGKRHARLRWLASRLGCRDLLDHRLCAMAPCESASDITELVHDHVKEAWKSYITDVPSYHRFNDSRGQWTLRRSRWCDGKKSIKSSLRRPFDESVILWHLATDLCFHRRRADSSEASRQRSREISNYMAYLLFANPEMLMPGARPSLFRDLYKQLKGMPLDHDGEKALAQQIIIQKLTNKDLEAPEGSGLVHKACALAQELLEIGEEDGEKMWEVIQGVWVEMLCFSAARCRGYLHAKSMGRGGEYLTYVWLLLLNMGMEPLSERMQRTETEDEDGGGAGDAAVSPASAPQETDIVED